MNYRKAFTLIELLVVIAIIAILAAILFPVFAQAKLMAKAAASTSNQKQQALSEIMYAGDNDDFAVPTTSYNNSAFPIFVGANSTCPWTYNVLPYTKNMTITNDPTGPVFGPVPAGWNYNNSHCVNPDYGYDYCVLAGFYSDGSGRRPVVSAHDPDSSMLTHRRPTPLCSPASSRLDQRNSSSFGQDNGQFSFWWFGYPGPLLCLTVDPPNCYTIPADCVDNWGTGSYFYMVGSTWLGITTVTAGRRITAGVSARAPVNQNGTYSFCDGHAKKLSWNHCGIPAGTNWTTTLRLVRSS